MRGDEVFCCIFPTQRLGKYRPLRLNHAADYEVPAERTPVRNISGYQCLHELDLFVVLPDTRQGVDGQAVETFHDIRLEEFVEILCQQAPFVGGPIEGHGDDSPV